MIHDAGDGSEWTAKAIAEAEARGLKVLSVGEGGTFLRLVSREPGQLGQVLHIKHEGETRKVNLPLIGAYQAANALVSAGLAMADPATHLRRSACERRMP